MIRKRNEQRLVKLNVDKGNTCNENESFELENVTVICDLLHTLDLLYSIREQKHYPLTHMTACE